MGITEDVWIARAVDVAVATQLESGRLGADQLRLTPVPDAAELRVGEPRGLCVLPLPAQMSVAEPRGLAALARATQVCLRPPEGVHLASRHPAQRGSEAGLLLEPRDIAGAGLPVV